MKRDIKLYVKDILKLLMRLKSLLKILVSKNSEKTTWFPVLS